MVAETDFEPVFSGKHDNSILGVANKDYPAAAIANSVMKRMIEREVISPDQIVSIYKSQTFPTTGYGVAHNLKPELKEKIRNAFFNFDWEGTALQEEFEKNGRRPVPGDELQGVLGRDPQDRHGQRRQLRLRMIALTRRPLGAAARSI